MDGDSLVAASFSPSFNAGEAYPLSENFCGHLQVNLNLCCSLLLVIGGTPYPYYIR